MRAMLPAHGLSQIGHQVMAGEIGWKDGEGFVIVPPIERLKSQHREIIKTYDQCFDKLDVIILKLYMHQDAVSYIKRLKPMVKQ